MTQLFNSFLQMFAHQSAPQAWFWIFQCLQ